MAFKLPNRPSTRPSVSELADFAEILTLLKGRCSATEIQRFLGRIDDNNNNIGIEDDDLINEVLSDAMMIEIGLRSNACPDGYPFKTDSAGTVLILREDGQSIKGTIYNYLLLATRMQMKNEKVQSGIDGTHIMEDLGAVILGSYLGVRAKSHVFGTASKGDISQKVGDLCDALKEGGIFESIDSGPVNAKDDGLDVVGWIPFSDQLSAKLCVFGQCKTGTSWKDHLNRLDPPGFIKRWMSGSFVVDPLKAYFISESADRAQWNGIGIYGGILFDRCRIVDLAGDVQGELIEKIRTWTNAAIDRIGQMDWI